ncbi:MAG: YfcE family phosphodiesterase [Smithella sp.]|nr:YfcE family phosphodiesterase [Smithella sp.]
MKIFAISDIHGAIGSIEKAAHLIREADAVVISGDITHTKTRTEAEDVLGCLEQHSKQILAVHGNWDRKEVGDFLEEKGFSLHGRGRILDGTGFFGVGGSSPTPLPTATVYSEEEIARILKTGYEQIRQASRLVVISHAPPRSVRDRSFFGLRGGSRSVQAFLSTHPVSLCLCGHIHEAHGVERFQNTLVVNTGSFKKGRYATIEIGAILAATPGRLR